MASNLHHEPVKAPPIDPAAHDLVASARRATDGNGDRWEGGIVFTPEGADSPTIYGVSTDASTDVDKSAVKTSPAEVTAVSWQIEASWTRPRGAKFWTPETLQALAERAFEQTQSALIEKKFAEGSVTGTPFLADSNCSRIGTTAVAPIAGLGRLQNAMAAVGGHGTIYMDPGAAAQLSVGNTLIEENGNLYTAERRDLIIVGNFGSHGPSASAAGTDESFMFATLGEPELYLSDAQYADVIDWAANNLVVQIEKTVQVKFVPGQWTTLVDLTP